MTLTFAISRVEVKCSYRGAERIHGGIALVTKKEIVRRISERAQLTQLKTKEIVQWTFDAIIETLIAEGRIELRNFGVFEVKQRKPRKARNPRTGARVDVEAKNVVTFQPGKDMEERVRDNAKPIPSKRKPVPKKAKAKAHEPSTNGSSHPSTRHVPEPVTAESEPPVVTS